MPVDLSEFLAASPSTPPTRCKTCVALEELDPDRAEKLRAACGTSSVSSAGITRVLKRWGIEIEESSVKRHRARHA